MATDRGLLPKADPDELDEQLQRRLERWFANAYRDDNLFLTMARRPGMLDAAWGFIRYIYGGESTVEPQLAELARVKLAWNNGCVHCSLARSNTATSRAAPEGADPSTGAATFERQVARLDDYESSDLPERTKMALRLADAISMAPAVVDEHFYARLREQFTDDEILDLGMTIAFFSGWQRFIESFKIVPDRWNEGDPLPFSALALPDADAADAGADLEENGSR